MEDRPRTSLIPSLGRPQTLTPITPSLPTSMPPVCESILPLPLTPPELDEEPNRALNAAAISTAIHVISTERIALAHLERLYDTDPVAQEGLANAVSRISKAILNGGKLVVSGVGKSGKIGDKIVATMNSFGIRSTFLHPTEALHGDLGLVGPDDIFLLVTFSGRTAELLSLISHLPYDTALIALTSHAHPSTCPLLADRINGILLPAPIHEPEQTSFGVSAPTTSTTVALALGDALALAVARRLHNLPGKGPSEVFHNFHPGGAIGQSVAEKGPKRMAEIATMVDQVPIAQPHVDLELRALDIIIEAVRSPGGWVRVHPRKIIAPRQIQKLRDTDRPVSQLGDIVVERTDWISILAQSTVDEAREWIERMRKEPRGRTFLKPGTILGIVDEKGEVSAVVEIEDVVGEEWGDNAQDHIGVK